MFFGKKTSQENAYSIPASSSEGGLRLSLIVACILLVLVIIAMVSSYLLGYRVGYNNGLELAHKNGLAQVMRIPVAKAVVEKIDGLNAPGSSRDIYEELKKQPGTKENAETKPAEVSKEVKEFLKPLPAATEKGSGDKTPVPAATERAVNQKKLDDSNAIRDALTQAEEERADDHGIRVIGESKPGSVRTTPAVEAEQVALNRQEDFRLPKADETKSEISGKTSLPTATPTVRITGTPAPTRTALVKTGSIAAKKLTYGWYTQVAAPKALQEAQGIAAKLKARGFKSAVETAQVGDQQYYRVVVGPEGSRLAAEQTLSRVRQYSGLKGEPFIRLVK